MEISGKHHSATRKTTAYQSFSILLAIFTLVLSACGGSGAASSGNTLSSGSSGGTADTTRPTVTITTPTTGTTTNSTLSLGGTASDNVGVTQVTWSNSTTGSSGTASGTTSWSVGGIALQTGTNSITIQARDAAGNTGNASLTVTFSSGSTGDTTAPTVTITSPTSNSSYTTGSATVSLSGSASDNVGITQVTWSNSTTGASGTASGTTSWSKSGIALQSGSNTITIMALDAAGNFGTDVLTVTYADLTPPNVQSTSPTSSATGISTSSTITVTFSEAMSAASINASAFLVNGVSGSISVNGTTATFTPSSALANSTTYTVTVVGGANGVKDASGNALAANYTWTFTTAVATAAADCASPTVLCVDDTAGATQEFSTIQAAVNVAVAGDTVLVMDGSYQGFRATRSGNTASPITIKANAANAVISQPEPNGSGDGIYLQNVSYVTVEGFIVRGIPNRGISHRGATPDGPSVGLIIRGNTVENSGLIGMYLSEVSNARIEDNAIRGTVRNGTEGHGIYLANAGSDNTRIGGNSIYSNQGTGIHMNGDISVGGDGIISGLIIENNSIYSNGLNGLNMDGVQNSTIRNNLLYLNGSNGIRAFKIDGAAGPGGLNIVNNTIYSGASGGWCLRITEDTGNNIAFNNILISDNSSTGSIALDATNGFQSANNVVVNRFTPDRDTTILSLGQWQARGYDSGSFVASTTNIFVDTSAGNFMLKSGSGAVDGGIMTFTSIPAPGVDILNHPRPAGNNIDIGAYECSTC